MSSDMKDTEPFGGLVINGYGIYSPSDQKRLAALIKRETDKAVETALQRLYDNAKYGEDWTANEVLERIELALKQQQTRGGSE